MFFELGAIYKAKQKQVVTESGGPASSPLPAPPADVNQVAVPPRKVVGKTMPISSPEKPGSSEHPLASPAKPPAKDNGDDRASASGKSATLSQALQKSASRFRCEADVVKASFEQYVKDQLSLKPFKHDLGRALTWHTMQHLQDECFACEEIKDFHKFQDKFDDAVEVAADLMAAVTGPAGDILQHNKTKLKQNERKAKADEIAKQKAMLKKVREDAAAAAAAIREKAGLKGKEKPALFSINVAECGGLTPTATFKALPQHGSEAWLKPFIVKSYEELTLLLGNAKVQKALSAYGGAYKKALGKSKEERGRHQERIEDTAELEACQTVLGSGLPQCDISGVDGGEPFMKGSFHFGYAASPNMMFVGMTPNCASVVKILAVGEVHMLMIDLKSLHTASAEKVGPPLENLDYIDTIAMWTKERMEQLIANGVVIHSAVHRQGELIHIPQGWIVCECTPPGHPFNYGLRKAFFHMALKATEQYQQCIALYEASAKDVSRMKAIEEVLDTPI